MFDAHVPARYAGQGPRVETDMDGSQQWWYGDINGRYLGLNAVAGKPREMFNVNLSATWRCGRGATTCTSASATCPTAGSSQG